MLQFHLKGSTLIENLVAMMILSIIIGLSLILIGKLSSQTPFGIKTRAEYFLQTYADSSIENNLYTSGFWNKDDLHFTRVVETYPLNSRLLVLHFSVFNDAQLLLTDQKSIVISIPSEKN